VAAVSGELHRQAQGNASDHAKYIFVFCARLKRYCYPPPVRTAPPGQLRLSHSAEGPAVDCGHAANGPCLQGRRLAP